MANQLPAKLRAADIQRFIHRASQLDKFKPPIAYWCRYQALNNILSRGLQNADEECMAYAAKLMDTVEEMKSQHAEDAAITDESIAPAYIQHFGLETFERADKTLRNNIVTAQTIDTLQAAVTFLDLLNIWQPLPPEIVSKVKYAKFHALRIAKAIKAGEDPNLSNPVQEPDPTTNPDDVQLDPNDPDVQRITSAAAYQPSIEEGYDSDSMVSPHTNRAPPAKRSSSVPRPMSTGAVSPMQRPQLGPHPPVSPDHQLSAGPSPLESNPRKSSLGGGYFPETRSPPPALYQAPNHSAPPHNRPLGPPPAPPSDAAARSFYEAQSPSVLPAQQPIPPQAPRAAPPPPQYAPPYANPPPSAPPPAPNTNGQFNDDDVAVATAQKHARWAISALNFEDVPTAVKELRQALRTLGAG